MPTQSMYGPELQAEQAAADRRRKLAEALQGNAMATPSRGQMVGRFYVPPSPLEGLVKAFQAYAGTKMGQESDTTSKDIAQRAVEGRSAALARAVAAGQGTPGQAEDTSQEGTGSFDMSGAAGPALTGGTPPNPQAGYQSLISSGDPMLSQLGMAGMTAQMAPKNVVVGRSIMNQNTGALVGSDPTLHTENEAKRLADIEKAKQAAADRAALAAAHPQPVTAVTIQDPNDPNGTIVIDGRTRAVLGKGPKLTDTGKMEKKREFNMQGIGSTIKEAEDLLTGTKEGVPGAGTLPTQSGFGSLLDTAGAFVGASPKGSIEAAKLQSVGGALVSKMPRMEGPQSDKDVMLYKEMAGKIGDASVPVAQRLAALETVKGIWAKYERLNPEAFADRRQGSGTERVVNW